MLKNFDPLSLKDRLEEKIRIFLDSIWKEKQESNLLENWSENFTSDEEKTHMLFLLSKFMFFGNKEIRELLTSIYRDFFKYPTIHKIRKNNGDTMFKTKIEDEYVAILNKTKFLGIGNPSESGVHLLYYFRQQNNLAKEMFITLSDIFKFIEKKKDNDTGNFITVEISDTNIENYIFIDDFCGSGNQVESELKPTLEILKKKNPNLKIFYFMMFGTDYGIKTLKDFEYLHPYDYNMCKIFDDVRAIFKLDESFKTFSDNSRFFTDKLNNIDQKKCKEINEAYSNSMICGPLGYNDCELMISFSHNTPDNSLPIFWNEQNAWSPFFKRYNKI